MAIEETKIDVKQRMEKLREKLIYFENRLLEDLDSIQINFVEENFSEKINETKNFLIEMKNNNKDDSYINLREKIISCENQLRNLNELHENIQTRFRSIYFERPSFDLTVDNFIGKLNGIGKCFSILKNKTIKTSSFFVFVLKRKI